MAIEGYKFITPEQRNQFLEQGWVKIENAVPEEYLKRFSDDAWVRLGMDPDDKATWTKEKVCGLSVSTGARIADCLAKIHMPRHREIPTKEFCPKAWGAICE